MISAKCEQCGSLNDFADEVCQKCGAELTDSAKTFYRGTSDYEPQAATPEIWEAPGGPFMPPPPPSASSGPFLSIGSVLSQTISVFINNIWLISKIVLVVFVPLEIFKSLSIGNHETTWQTGAGVFLLGLFCKALVLHR